MGRKHGVASKTIPPGNRPRLCCHKCQKGNRPTFLMPGKGVAWIVEGFLKAPAVTRQLIAVLSNDLRDEAMGPRKSCLFFLMGQRHPWNFISHGDMVLYLAKLHHSRRSQVLPSSPRKTEGKV